MTADAARWRGTMFPRFGRGARARAGLWACCALACLSGCPSEEHAEAAAKVGLKVPLPDGWVAQPDHAGSLRIGPKGRVALTVEHRAPGVLPEPTAVKAVLESEGATGVSALALADGWLFRYEVGSQTQALVGARALPRGLVLCASEPRATLDDVKQAAQVCSSISATAR